MTLQELRSRLAGVSAVTITPFVAESLEIDHDGIRRIVRLMEHAGIDVIVPCGGTGEYYALTESERRAVVETTIDEARHTPVVVGVGTGVREASEAAQHAEQSGAAGVMVHQPIGVGVHPSGLVDYYAAIASSVSIGIVAYVRGPMFSAEVLGAIGSIENVIAVKFAVEDPKLFAITSQAVGQTTDLVWICGAAESWAPFFWAGGATGFTSGIANFAPEKAISMRDALAGGSIADIRQCWSDLKQLEVLRDRQSTANNISVVKVAAELTGLCSNQVRPPLAQLSSTDQADLEALLESWLLTPATRA